MYGLCGTIFIFQFSSIIIINYDASVYNWQSIASIIIAIVYILILMPFFAKVFFNIQEAFMMEVRLSYSVKDQFKRMFDSLQEGIVVLNDGEIEYMNDLSNKFMAILSGMYDFQNHLNEDQEKSKINPLDRKIFYVFEVENNKDGTRSAKKKEKSKIAG
jgi:sensor histidine kinase regulating citrate/malate metabolism